MIYYLLIWSFVLDGELHEGRQRFNTLLECEIAREKILSEPIYKDVHPGLVYCDGFFATPNYSPKKQVNI